MLLHSHSSGLIEPPGDDNNDEAQQRDDDPDLLSDLQPEPSNTAAVSAVELARSKDIELLHLLGVKYIVDLMVTVMCSLCCSCY